MPRTRVPAKGRYALEYEYVYFKGERIAVKSCTYNGTTRRFQRWRKRRRQQQELSRKINRIHAQR